MSLEHYDWPLICLTHNTVTDEWFPTLYVKHPHRECHRYRFLFHEGFPNREDCAKYALGEFLDNVDRLANHEVVIALDAVFEWDGDGPPDPGAWSFA
jgi:hypothetical protein